MMTSFLVGPSSLCAQNSRPKVKPARKRAGRNQNALKGATVEIYKTIGDVQLKMYLFKPKNHQPEHRKPAIVFFFGGGWRAGSPAQFGLHCQYLASRGMVAMAADYRVESRHQTKAIHCVADAKSAIRWIRKNSKRLGIDPNKIVAAGGSAGGHLAAATATISGFNEKGESTEISSQPNALILFNPALNLTPAAFNESPDSKRMKGLQNRLGTEFRNLSPVFHISKTTPPCIIFHGEADKTVPFKQATEFAAAMKKRGLSCEVAGYPDEGHGFFNFGRKGNVAFLSTLSRADAFLVSLGYLKGNGNVKEFFKMSNK
ncbi:MAG: alpha/beta hydrolase [Planctomycetaceae bacterium]